MGRFDKDSLGDRQKKYEMVSANYLMPKEPVIIRVDGRAFHTFTRGMDKPFDFILGMAMKRTMVALCSEIQNCVFGYTQSDEITLVLKVLDKKKSEEYLAGKVQKITSITASKATRYFNQFFIEQDADKKYPKKYFQAEFDCRTFNIPEWDVINNLIWRQQDATRNSIEAVGHASFRSSEMHKKNTSEVMDMLMLQKGINWNDFTTYEKRGACCYKVENIMRMLIEDKKTNEKKSQEVRRQEWFLDENMPILTEKREWFSSITGVME